MLKIKLKRLKNRLIHYIKYGYSANIIHRYNIFSNLNIYYCDVSKVASTSIKTLLYEQAYGTKLNEGVDIHYHMNRNRLESFELPKNHQDYFSFSVVRNPFERIVSAYKNQFQQGKWASETYLFGIMNYDISFEAFIKWITFIPDRIADEHFVSQYAILYDKRGKCRVEHIGKFEQLNDFWQNIVQKYCNTLPDLPHYNATSTTDWKDYYTIKTAEKVYQRYKKDFETFGYEEKYQKLIDYLTSKSKTI